jgi:branched-chain amino acid transport system ATP-binding protein
MTNRGTTDRSVLKIDDLTAGYGGGDVLRGVGLEVRRGGITCVVGPNGAGKSTLMRCVSGLLKPRLGTMTLDGEPLAGKSPREILQLGVVQVPQNHSLFRDMTVWENIELGGYILGEKAQITRRIDAVFDLFPQIADWKSMKAGSLSGGQQRLVEFARALMLEPALLLLDEPSMGLAPKILKTVFAAVRQMNESGTTILLVEQNARAGLRLSSHGVVMENGQVRLSGTGREVLEHPEIGALYLGGAVREGLPRARYRQAVTDRDHDQLDPLVRGGVVVEVADGDHHRAVVPGVDDPAVRERVVDHDQAAGVHPGQHLAPVVQVAALVRVDERDVELGRARQLAQRPVSRTEAQLDPVAETRLLPVLLRDRGPLRVDVAADQVPVRGEPAGDADGGVTGEGADLDPGGRAGQLGQQGHERALLGRDLQAGLGREQVLRLVSQLSQNGVRRAAVRGEIRVEMEADLLGSPAHETTLPV